MSKKPSGKRSRLRSLVQVSPRRCHLTPPPVEWELIISATSHPVAHRAGTFEMVAVTICALERSYITYISGLEGEGRWKEEGPGEDHVQTSAPLLLPPPPALGGNAGSSPDPHLLSVPPADLLPRFLGPSQAVIIDTLIFA